MIIKLKWQKIMQILSPSSLVHFHMATRYKKNGQDFLAIQYSNLRWNSVLVYALLVPGASIPWIHDFYTIHGSSAHIAHASKEIMFLLKENHLILHCFRFLKKCLKHFLYNPTLAQRILCCHLTLVPCKDPPPPTHSTENLLVFANIAYKRYKGDKTPNTTDKQSE